MIAGIFFIKDGECLLRKWLLIKPELTNRSLLFLVAEELVNKTRFKHLFKGATDLKLQRMYRVDKKLFVVLKEIGLKKENLIVLIKNPFFIECRCDVAEDTNYLIQQNHSFPFFYSLTKINFVLLHAINLKIVINYFFTV